MEELLKELLEYTARGTELISVYVPSGFNISQVVNQIEKEVGTATNIKSNATRKNVLESLEKVIRILKEYKQTPKNGLAVFVGHVSGLNGLQSWEIEPPVKLNRRLYQCDKNFILKPLYELITDGTYYLLVVIENGECSVGTYSNGHIKLKKKLTALIPSDNKCGGQSSQRFERIRQGLKKAFRKKVAEFINTEFLFDKNMLGIVLGGTFVTVDEFSKSKDINTQLKQKIVSVKNVSCDGMKGLEELSIKAMEDIANSEVIAKENMVDEFFKQLAKNPDKVVYGIDDVVDMIAQGRMDRIISINKVNKTFLNAIIIDDGVRRYSEIQGLGGIVGFLRY
jgi:peptide chain release factor subunit 1